jgi:hypothetical protein
MEGQENQGEAKEPLAVLKPFGPPGLRLGSALGSPKLLLGHTKLFSHAFFHPFYGARRPLQGAFLKS